ncbi:lipid-A-disaccharide synthase, partial [Pseudoalteromonas sp. S327]
PSETEITENHQVESTFVAHTLAVELALEHDDSHARQQLGLNTDDNVVAFLPGSRGAEVGFLSETYLKTAAQLQPQNPDRNIVVTLVNANRKAQFSAILNAPAPNLIVTLVFGQSKLAM